MGLPLTRRQAQALAAIRAAVEADGYPPTYRELCATLGATSPNAAAGLLKALVRGGHLVNPEGHARGLGIPGFRPQPPPPAAATGLPELTSRRREILAWCHDSIRARGYPPSLRDIMARFGFASPNTVLGHLKILEEQGYIARRPGRGRALRILALPAEAEVSRESQESTR